MPPARNAALGRAGIGLIVLVFVLLVGAPLAELVGVVGTAGVDPVVAALTGPAARDAVAGTLVVAAGVCGLAVPGGTLLALVTERTSVPARGALRVALLVPLLVPEFVQGFSWSLVYGPAGYSDRLLGVVLPGLLGPVGVIVVLAVNTVPVVYLIVAAALAVGGEPELERAARASGASALTAFRTVTLPLLRMPLAAALALSFATAVGSFAVPKVLGVPGGFATMTTRIYATLNFAAAAQAFTQVVVLALALVVLVTLVVGPTDLAVGRGRPVVRSRLPAGRLGAGPPSPAGVALAGLVWAYVGLAVAVPLAGVVLTALTPAVGVPPVPANWTLSNFAQATAGQALPGLVHSLLLGVSSASILVALGAVVVALQQRTRGGWLSTLVTLTFAVPGSALAVGVLLAYGRWLTGSLLLVLIAYLAKLWAVAHRPLAGAADRLPPDLVRAARVSGASAVTGLRTVVAPMLAPALAGAWALVFVFALHELTMSSLLYGPGSVTLAVVVLNFAQLGYVGATAALAVVVTVLPLAVAAPLAVYARLTARRVRAVAP